MSSRPTLTERHTDATQQLILASAVELLAQADVNDVTARAVARHAGISERTVFRYFASRDAFLDAVAGAAAQGLQLPPPPASVQALREYPARLYPCFEDKAALVQSVLHTELFKRVREKVISQRWPSLDALIDSHAPQCSAHERRLAAIQVRYYLSATTWHYHRFHFNLSPKETVECAQTALRLCLDGLNPGAGAPIK
ncbi:TetR/AcrR family transcriptional regulator [Azohydromonas lata]|uniref:TetR/AcrR family transcriptional regulator n=1 Tax=Azohydromonas lata TaxID=45677 RepID=UPI001471390E|nr:TetR/AcrR family transcriptional regulator [Azohydromonas lata]